MFLQKWIWKLKKTPWMEAEIQHKILQVNFEISGKNHQWKPRYRWGVSFLFKWTAITYSPITKNITMILSNICGQWDTISVKREQRQKCESTLLFIHNSLKLWPTASKFTSGVSSLRSDMWIFMVTYTPEVWIQSKSASFFKYSAQNNCPMASWISSFVANKFGPQLLFFL
jgi:hypothetical protein